MAKSNNNVLYSFSVFVINSLILIDSKMYEVPLTC